MIFQLLDKIMRLINAMQLIQRGLYLDGCSHPEPTLKERSLLMNLTAPTQIVFFLSVIIAILALLAFYGTLSFIPLAAFWILLIAYVILAVGCLLKGV